jgi:hypothetical protein
MVTPGRAAARCWQIDFVLDFDSVGDEQLWSGRIRTAAWCFNRSDGLRIRQLPKGGVSMILFRRRTGGGGAAKIRIGLSGVGPAERVPDTRPSSGKDQAANVVCVARSQRLTVFRAAGWSVAVPGRSPRSARGSRPAAGAGGAEGARCSNHRQKNIE